MLYYKVKTKYNNYQIYKTDIGYATSGRCLVANELYTKKELLRYRIPLKCVDEIETSTRNTHFFFGARFINE